MNKLKKPDLALKAATKDSEDKRAIKSNKIKHTYPLYQAFYMPHACQQTVQGLQVPPSQPHPAKWRSPRNSCHLLGLYRKALMLAVCVEVGMRW